MKLTMKFLARLYPSTWRARYSAELECLLEETRPSVRDAFDILWGAFTMQMTAWSFRRIMLAWAAAGILAATAISFAVPVHYQSHVTLMVTPPGESGNLLVNKAARMLAPLPDSRSTFRVLDPPALPHAPAGPNRMQFAAVGLLTGILCRVMLAIMAKTRLNTSARNG